MNINLSLSTQSYKIKPSNEEISKMQFTNTNISIEVFAELIKNGYNFTHQFTTTNPTFSIKEKIKNNYKSTQIVCLDIDNGNKPFNEFICKLTYQPTISYTSPSYDVLNEKYKFRLIYVFNDLITNPNEYESLYWCLVNQMNIDNEFTNDDNRVRNISYYFNGSFGCDMINNFNQIYNIKDFNFAIKNNNDNDNDLYINLKCKKEIDNKQYKIDKVFLKDLNSLEPFQFIQKYKEHYPIIERTPIEFIDGYAILDDDYIEIKRKWTWGEIQTSNGLSSLYTITQKIKDGQGRRYHLGLAAMIRRKINPNITLEHLILNAVYDRQYYYDNSDGMLSNKVLIERCTYVMNLKTINIKSYNKKKFIVDKEYWSEKGINPNQAKMIVRKQMNHQEIGSWYDCSLSVKDNLVWAKENNIKVSQRTLYNFCKENDINTNPNKQVKKTNNKYTNKTITNNMNQNELDEKVSILNERLNQSENIDTLNEKYNKCISWINNMITKYDLKDNGYYNIINQTYKNQYKQLKKKVISVAHYSYNDLYDLLKMIQSSSTTDLLINGLLVKKEDEDYPWELVANKQTEYIIYVA